MKLVGVLFLILAFTACKDNRQSVEQSGNIHNCAWTFEEKKSVGLFIDSVEYVTLETHDEGLFKAIDKFLVKNGRYYIFDCFAQNQVLVFNLEGRFLFRVGRKGRAPGEYWRIRNFTVDDQYIYLITNEMNTIMIYDMEGKFVKQKEIPFIAFDMAAFRNGDFIFSWHQNEGASINTGLNKVTITNPEFSVKRQLFPLDKNDCIDLSQRSYFVDTDSMLIYHSLFSDTVYVFDKKQPELIDRYVFDFGKNRIPVSKRKTYEEDWNYRYLTNTPILINRYLVGRYCNFEKDHVYLYDIKERKAYSNTEGAKYTLFPPLGEENGSIISVMTEGVYEYQVKRGMQRAPEAIEESLENGDYVLVKYKLK